MGWGLPERGWARGAAAADGAPSASSTKRSPRAPPRRMPGSTEPRAAGELGEEEPRGLRAPEPPAGGCARCSPAGPTPAPRSPPRAREPPSARPRRVLTSRGPLYPGPWRADMPPGRTHPAVSLRRGPRPGPQPPRSALPRRGGECSGRRRRRGWGRGPRGQRGRRRRARPGRAQRPGAEAHGQVEPPPRQLRRGLCRTGERGLSLRPALRAAAWRGVRGAGAEGRLAVM